MGRFRFFLVGFGIENLICLAIYPATGEILLDFHLVLL